MPKSCGNQNCCSSTGIHEGMTFGHGRLDEYGFWEFPCRTCAKEWDANKEQRISDLKNQGFTQEKLDSNDYAWVTMPGWPFDDGPYPAMPPEENNDEFEELERIIHDC